MNANTAPSGLVIVVAALAGGGCAEPIQSEFYSRTPSGEQVRPHANDPPQVSVGIGCDGTSVSDLQRETAAAFIVYASENSPSVNVDWVKPSNMAELDCQVDLSLSLEHSGSTQVQYCLGRLIGNIYNADHSELLARVVLFHEGMYTAKRKMPHLTHDGVNVHLQIRDALFGQLVSYFSDGT